MISTGRQTIVSISERSGINIKEPHSIQREHKIIIHDGWMWHMGYVPDEKQLENMLSFLEIERTGIDHEANHASTGKIVFYTLSKDINSPCDGGFWNLEQLKELSNGKRLKKIKGLSNGSLVDCYVSMDEDVINVYRPNPNAKDVYVRMDIKDEREFKRNKWYL